ncbi:hypothetical protein BLNAU_2058 [Blattamonas nauphoetae]|uniref:Uncharacterized protein n=1 Tax=Blattamonas nauphoetae TaxID=2049346 RepID=A0ABQ9YHA7_9EUKA|nr:hypothetical protein BLNAU_2058 [Blattamonas nauphoetae]
MKMEKEKTKADKEIIRLKDVQQRVQGELQKSRNDNLKLQLADLPIWLGTESLQTVDRTTHRLTPTTLTQIVRLEKNNDWRTVFTFPISNGEWELKIKASDTTFYGVMLGFLKHPLPANATQSHSGTNAGGIGGDFILWDGSMWKYGEIKPEGTNKKCERFGQTAAIRVNMSSRQARLVVDDQEQPGIFTNIPSPLCLGITTQEQDDPIEVLWLKRLRSY